MSTKLSGPSIREIPRACGRAGSGAATTPPVETGGNAAGEPDVRSWLDRGWGGENDGTGVAVGDGVGTGPPEPCAVAAPHRCRPPGVFPFESPFFFSLALRVRGARPLSASGRLPVGIAVLLSLPVAGRDHVEVQSRRSGLAQLPNPFSEPPQRGLLARLRREVVELVRIRAEVVELLLPR